MDLPSGDAPASFLNRYVMIFQQLQAVFRIAYNALSHFITMITCLTGPLVIKDEDDASLKKKKGGKGVLSWGEQCTRCICLGCQHGQEQKKKV